MKYELVDVINKKEDDVHFGTCDLCEYIGTHEYDILVFRDENGDEYEVENGEWDWGVYLVKWYIDNYVDFAAFIKGKDFSKPKKDLYGFLNMEEIVNEMYWEYDKAIQGIED